MPAPNIMASVPGSGAALSVVKEGAVLMNNS